MGVINDLELYNVIMPIASYFILISVQRCSRVGLEVKLSK